MKLLLICSCLAFICVIPQITLAVIGTSRTIVGSPIYVDGAITSETYFDFSSGITHDTQGNLYVADTENNAIRKIDTSTGIVTRFIGNGSYGDSVGSSRQTEFAHPTAIAINETNQVFIVDGDNKKIKKFSDNTTTTIIEQVDPRTGIAALKHRLYYTDPTTNRLYRSNRKGKKKKIITDQLNDPIHLKIRSTGDYAYVINNYTTEEIVTSEIVRVQLNTGEITSLVKKNTYGSLLSQINDIFLVEGTDINQDDLFVSTAGGVVFIDLNQSFSYTWQAGGAAEQTSAGLVRQYVPAGNFDNYNSNSLFLGQLATRDMELLEPAGLTIAGNVLYIIDHDSGQIFSGTIPNLAQGDYLYPYWKIYAGKDRFQSVSGVAGYPGRPKDIVVTKDGTTLYFSENNQIKALALSSDHTITSLVGSAIDNYPRYDLPVASGSEARLSDPSAITLSPDETSLYVVDRNNNRIRRVNIATHEIYYITGYGNTNDNGSGGNGYNEGEACHSENGNYSSTSTKNCAKFSRPYGIAMDPAGKYVYISDTDNHVIRKVKISGEHIGSTSLVAGTPQQSGFADGTGTQAQFFTPEGLTIDRDGKYLYVADRDNHALRKIQLSDGVVSTLVGHPNRRGEQNGNLTTAQLNLPVEVYVKKNMLFFSDASKRLRKVDMTTNTVSTSSGNGQRGYHNGSAQTTEFENILGIFVKKKQAFVTDSQNDVIRTVKVK